MTKNIKLFLSTIQNGNLMLNETINKSIQVITRSRAFHFTILKWNFEAQALKSPKFVIKILIVYVQWI